MACGESVAPNERGSLGVGYREIGIFYCFAIKRTKVAAYWRCRPLPRTESFLTADINWQFGFQFTASYSQETGEAAKMIVVTMTEHQGIESSRINA